MNSAHMHAKFQSMEFFPFLDYVYHVMVVMIHDRDQDLSFLDDVDHVRGDDAGKPVTNCHCSSALVKWS